MAQEVASSGLFGTTVTLEYLEKKLQEVLDTSAKFGPNVSTEQFGVFQGFLSVMVRLKPDWQGENIEGLPISFAVKIPSAGTLKFISKQTSLLEKMDDAGVTVNIDEALKNIDQALEMVHASEVSFYNMVGKDKLNVLVPKCYYTELCGSNGENGLLIMEDLGNSAAIKPIYEGLSVESIKAVLDNLAEVHAYSLLHDQWLSNPDMKMTYPTFQKMLGGGTMGQFSNMMIGMMTMLKKSEPAMFDPLIDRFLDIFLQKFDFGDLDTLHEKLGLPPVLTHGDLWINNMMWRKTEDGKSTTDELVAIVDWQLVHPGCVGEDLVRLLCSSVEPSIRREHLDDFLQHYHNSLKSKLGKEPPFTVAQLANAYKLLFRDGVVMILPGFGGFVQSELGMMGIENVEQRKQDVLNRAKALLEDLYTLQDELGIK